MLWTLDSIKKFSLGSLYNETARILTDAGG